MPSDPPIHEFYVGGYFLVQPFVGPPDGPPEFVPEDLVIPPLITVAGCFAEVLPTGWAFRTWWPMPRREEREEGARGWGIPPAVIDDLEAWATEARQSDRVLYDDVFVDLDTAREFARRFLPVDRAVRLLGIGLHRDELPGFLRDVEDRREVFPGSLGSPSGTHEGVARRVGMSDGRDLGYEVLDIAMGQCRHSWHCHHLERRLFDQFGVRLAPGGHIIQYEHAVRVASWCDEHRGSGCEPGVWRAWRVIEYGVAAS